MQATRERQRRNDPDHPNHSDREPETSLFAEAAARTMAGPMWSSSRPKVQTTLYQATKFTGPQEKGLQKDHPQIKRAA
jgi:hypothetical protein